jgi:hypothetical protein
MAADSQTTWDSGKKWDTQKLRDIGYGLGRALIAEAGAVITSTSIVDHLEQLVESPGSSGRSISDLAEAAVRKTRDKLRFQQFDCSSEELERFIQRNEMSCALMIAHYADGPRIDTVTLDFGISQQAKTFFECIGSGSDLATYLLGELCEPGKDTRTNCLIGALVVEIVKRHDQYCGGPVRIGVLRKPHYPSPDQASELEMHGLTTYGDFLPIVFSPQQVEEIVELALKVEAETGQRRQEIIKTALQRKSEDEMKQLYE